jgi:lon-related putative ATP-dependent protease
MAPRGSDPAARATARRVEACDLERTCPLEDLAFGTTAELEPLDHVVGQDRAVDAIAFGLGLAHPGYNLFAMGPEGIGRRTIVRQHLQAEAARREPPADWCYVFNFGAPGKPGRLRLPAGHALKLQADMGRLVDELRLGIPAAFETDEYRARRQELETEFSDRQEQAIAQVGARAREQKIALLHTPGGFGFAPMEDEGVMAPERFHALPEAEQKRIQEAIQVLQKDLEAVIESVPKWRREAQQKVRELDRQVTHSVVRSLIEELRSAYDAFPEVLAYLDQVREDVLDHAALFQPTKEGEGPTLIGALFTRGDSAESRLQRYQVNVLVHHEADGGAPIVYEDHPTHDNLVGRIEHESRMGALETDFTLVRAGALHRANGGFLILDAVKVLTEPLAWDALKRALRSREIRTEPLGHALGLISTVSLEPEPIPLDVKVVLVGPRLVYYLLHALDPELGELFKVVVDFEEDLPSSAAARLLFARLVASALRARTLRPLDRLAVARVIEDAARRADDAERLSVGMAPLVDLLVEADHFAAARGATVGSAEDVDRAIEARDRRADRAESRLRQEILRGTLLVATEGERVGQVNGLAVTQLGGHAFGMPVRITATVRLGAGRVLDIEREAQLGGPIHSKGVLILSGFLAGRYLPNDALSLAASLVFEQSYGTIEGDSASAAELFALLSALADVPVRQGFAVTGSVSQQGDVQAVGSVNEKVEGFFAVCRERGLTGKQGVLVPEANVKNLVLHRDVTQALRAGTFHLYAIETVDQGLAALTGLSAGERDALGRFPAGTVNGRIEARLADLAQRAARLFVAHAAPVRPQAPKGPRR